MAAASSTATDRPTPNCLIVGSPLRMKPPKTEIMMMAAAGFGRGRRKAGSRAPNRCPPASDRMAGSNVMAATTAVSTATALA
jgi:hypothetical protein